MVCGGLTFAGTRWVSQTADHDLTTAQTVGGVRVRQATPPEQIHRFHHLKTTTHTKPSQNPESCGPGVLMESAPPVRVSGPSGLQILPAVQMIKKKNIKLLAGVYWDQNQGPTEDWVRPE